MLGRLAAIVAAAAIVGFIAFTALGVGGGKDPQAALKLPAKPRHESTRQRYSEEVGRREAGTSHLNERIPIQPTAFDKPIATYKAYALRQVPPLASEVAQLDRAIATGDLQTARADWRNAFATYLRLGAVYGAFADIDAQITGSLHRLERGLWQGGGNLQAEAAQLTEAVAALPKNIRKEEIAPLDYVTRAHEILEDAQRDFLSGMDVPYSGEGVVAADSGLAATREVVHTLQPLLRGYDTGAAVDLGLHRFGQTLDRVRADHGGTLPPLAGLNATERERVNGSLSFALERLQLLPSALETTDLPKIPRLTS